MCQAADLSIVARQPGQRGSVMSFADEGKRRCLGPAKTVVVRSISDVFASLL